MKQKLNYRKPSKKQLKIIHNIEDAMKTSFDGDSFEDAREWIIDHHDDFEKAKKDLKDDYEYWNSFEKS